MQKIPSATTSSCACLYITTFCSGVVWLHLLHNNTWKIEQQWPQNNTYSPAGAASRQEHAQIAVGDDAQWDEEDKAAQH